MLVSVFTPSHDPRHLDDCYRTLAAQTHQDWEWAVVLNGAAADWKPPQPDERVKIIRARIQPRVGMAKHVACALCTGDILVELDHDDLLASTCLEEVHDAFVEHPDVVCVFTDFAQINEDGSRNDERFNEAMGWEYDEHDVDGTMYLRCKAMAAYPHNLGYIWFAPNHVRAFRRSAYERIGGYDRSLSVLDDQEIMMRLFVVGEFHHIPRCLYLQRRHPANTQVDPATNSFIQEQTVRYYDEWIDNLATAWSDRKGLEVLTLVTSTSPEPPDDTHGRVVQLDPSAPKLDVPDDSVGLIRGIELLQRLPDRAAFFNECYRALVHGGVIITRTPSTDGRGAFQDPSHVAFYNENSFWYLTQARFRRSIPDLTARLQLTRVRTLYPTQADEQSDISYVEAVMLAIKDGPRIGGALLA